MRRGAYRSMIVLVVALAILTSGCFQIRNFNQKPRVLGPGEVGKVNLQMYQASQSEQNTDGWTFILIGYEHADLRIKKVGNFDSSGNYGGPFAAVKDDALRDFLLTEANCIANGVSASEITGMTWAAYRTGVMDSTAGAYDEPLSVQIRLKRWFADPDERGDFVIISGTALLISGSLAATACTSMVFSSYSAAE